MPNRDDVPGSRVPSRSLRPELGWRLCAGRATSSAPLWEPPIGTDKPGTSVVGRHNHCGCLQPGIWWASARSGTASRRSDQDI